MANSTNDEETICPICFNGGGSDDNNQSSIDLVYGPCQHHFCRSCVERVLLDSPRHEPHPEDAHLAAPTLGRCPICRDELNLFDLRDGKTGELVYTKDLNLWESPLAGLIYVIRGGRIVRDPVGHESIHFPNEAWDTRLAYVNFEAKQEKLDDGTLIPLVKYFEEGCFFHPPTRTFHGSIVWSKSNQQPTLKGSNQWDYYLQFSSDLRFIARGIIVKRRDNTTCSNEPRFPLDGLWKVTWNMASGDETSGHIKVQGNVIDMAPYQYVLDFSDKRNVRFEWPLGVTSADRQPVVQTALSGLDLVEQPQGPAIGESVVWTTTDPNHVQIIWQRETIGGPPPPIVIPLGPPGGKMYQRLHQGGTPADESSSIPTYHPQSLWGNTFCQGLKVGLASYQFNSANDDGGGAYISYEHPLCGRWPPLDDGSPVPPRVPFRNVVVNDAQRTFRGTIEWTQDYGISWQGMSRWIYEMRFDSEFTCILSGTVRSVNNHGDEEEMSKFGEDLIYVNAGMTDWFRGLVVAAQAQANQMSNYDLFSRLSRELRQRLVREGASVRTMAMLHHVFVSSLHDDASPIDYNL